MLKQIKTAKDYNRCKCGCNKIIINRNQYYDNKHQKDYQRNLFIERWLRGEESGRNGRLGISKHIRRYLMEMNNYKCSKCGWGKKNKFSNKVPLEINHIDGRHINNSIDNLELLCPNCHSLTSTYKNVGGKSRKSTRKYRYLKINENKA
tara:strand:- start:39 stop:485 length:447 start_codon:yes stop_codon:yes gene_type:complete